MLEMQQFTVTRITELTDQVTEECVDLFIRSFGIGTLVFDSITEKNPKFRDAFFRSSILSIFNDPGGEYYVAKNEAGQVVGAAMWFGPGGTVFSSPETRQRFIDTLLSKVSAETRKWWLETYGPTVGRIMKEAVPPNGHIDTWYLLLIGVLPEYRRLGIATSLIKTVERKAQGSILSVTAAEDYTAKVYQGLGFEIGGQDEIWTPEGPHSPVFALKKDLKLD
ncbi:hypothetical protein C8Q75DRAFT_14765 [Abortiporus biennis]|nr:hypothetical protein C8Q75DRAFT_14765 [Abortiporus biennis]